MPIFNSNNPLSPGEDMYRECELGLDKEVIEYIKENHDLQIKVGGEPFYLFQRVEQGTRISQSITSWSTTSPQYSALIWQPGDGEAFHPNHRAQENSFVVFNNAAPLTRVYDKDSIAYDNEYALEMLRSNTSSTFGTVKIWFNPGFTPGNVSYAFRNLCSCVDESTGYPNRECPICKGTSYPPAFEQYTCAATKYHPINTVLVRVPMAVENLPVEQIGRVRRREHRHWMETTPYVKNYDLIMGTAGRNAGILFEVTGKYDSRWRGILTHQEFDTIRIEESDIRYQLAPISVIPTTTEIVTITSDAVIVT